MYYNYIDSFDMYVSLIIHGFIIYNQEDKTDFIEHYLQMVQHTVNARDIKGVTVLQNAVKYCRLNVIKLLLRYDANVNDIDRENQATALHYAVSRQYNFKFTNILLENDAAINVKDINGMTPLLLALRHNAYDSAKLLLNRGAELHLDDSPIVSKLPLINITLTDEICKLIALLIINYSDKYKVKHKDYNITLFGRYYDEIEYMKTKCIFPKTKYLNFNVIYRSPLSASTTIAITPPPSPNTINNEDISSITYYQFIMYTELKRRQVARQYNFHCHYFDWTLIYNSFPNYWMMIQKKLYDTHKRICIEQKIVKLLTIHGYEILSIIFDQYSIDDLWDWFTFLRCELFPTFVKMV